MSLLYLGNSKRCSKCGKYKDMATEYHKSANENRMGVKSQCKTCSQRRKYRDQGDRFWKTFYPRAILVGKCREWTGAYGGGIPRCMWQGNKDASVRRVVYQLAIGSIPEGMIVLTTCHNKRCVKQGHLVLGTAEEREILRCNSAPSGSKNGTHTHPERVARGEHINQAKLSEAIVRDIRQRAARGEMGKEIARFFGVTPACISAILTDKTWKHVQ